jgi:hypothetical protein
MRSFIKIVALFVGGLSATAVYAGPISVNLSSGTFANPGLVAGSAHSTGTAITWNYTGNFADPRYVAYVSTFASGPPNNFQIFHTTHMANGAATSNTAYGPDVPLGTPAYTGVEFYYVTFSLPSDATNVALNFSRIGADDRMQFLFNGQLMGYWGGNIQGAIGKMDGIGSQPDVLNVAFNRGNVLPSLTNQSLFNIGGVNVMRFWVNNTNSTSVAAEAIQHSSSGDPSTLDIRAVLTYDTAAVVPEPATFVLSATAVLALGAFRLRRQLRFRR